MVHAGLQTRNDVEIDEPNHVCYPIVGCFDNEYPFDCLGTRNLPSKFKTAGSRQYRNDNFCDIVGYRTPRARDIRTISLLILS